MGGGGRTAASAASGGSSGMSNREYMEREESLALEKARRIRDAMRQAAESLPELPGLEATKEPATGISDGTWYSERLKKIQGAPSENRGENPGLMERIGQGLDAWATKPVRDSRPWDAPPEAGAQGEGFRPLEEIGKLASQVGETAQSLVSLPQLNRNAAGERERPHRETAREEQVGRPEEPANRPAELPVREARPEAVPERNAAASPPQNGASLMGRLSERVRPGGRKSEGEPEEVAAAPGPERLERMVSKVSPAAPEVGNGGGRTSGGEERFELEDVISAGGAGPAGRGKPARAIRQGMAEPGMGTDEGALSSRLKGAGHWAAPRGREAATIPEPAGPLAGDASLYIVRVTGGAFYPFGGEGSDPVPLGPGSLVRVTKPGQEWSGVETAEGGKGIIRTEHIRRARESEVVAGRIPERSPEPARRPALPGSAVPVEIRSKAPQTAPEPGTAPPSGLRLLGDGLLPPLLEEEP